MPATLQDDVDFYTFVHHMRRSAAENEAAAERRRRNRRPYACRQWVAPVVGDETPDESDYVAVECRDISTGGFSYVSPQRPQRERLSVRLGLPGSWLYLSARVAHCCDVQTENGPAVMVGCQFTGRE